MDRQLDFVRGGAEGAEGAVSNGEGLVETVCQCLVKGGIGSGRSVEVFYCEGEGTTAVNGGAEGEGEFAVGVPKDGGGDVRASCSYPERISMGEGVGPGGEKASVG